MKTTVDMPLALILLVIVVLSETVTRLSYKVLALPNAGRRDKHAQKVASRIELHGLKQLTTQGARCIGPCLLCQLSPST